ncbi:uncharacterized protein LOC132389589 isoform X2 [Hypanus sabinus]|uniref:uncharacterized protein LOC132389589 isoform X2 n=1 Tax=Hypanus sabinus TaxID=79690 RepID=UPI0028C3F4AD|nr:uncharacterized protein LOC132389589 isoform X2 [Hypanus sabinus]
MPTTAQADDLDPTYSRLNLLQNELPIANEEDPPIASGPGEMSHAGPHKQEPNDNIGNGPDRKMSLLSMVTSVLFLTVVGLSIHVSQIRQSKVTCNRTDNELNSTLQSMVSALNSNLSVLQQKHSDLRHQFCGLLTSRREFYRESCPRPRQFILDWKMRRRGSGLKCRVQCERWEVRMQ